MNIGHIRSWFPNRLFGFIAAQVSGSDVFFHRVDVEFDPAQITVGRRVQFEILEYQKDGQKKIKAINVQLPPTSGGGVQ